jgi:hypothetical protein
MASSNVSGLKLKPLKRELLTRTYVCPSCNAESGRYCVSKNGKPIKSCHIARYKLFDATLT